MRILFHQGTWIAGAAKIGIVTLGVLLLWRLRSRRLVFRAAVGLTVAFVALVTYEVLWLS